MLLKINAIGSYRNLQKLCRRMASTELPIKVQVKAGVIIGKQGKLSNGGQYNSFLGIPYAVPPMGKLRFQSPVPLKRFDQPELDCTQERDLSYHRHAFTNKIVGSENCLFLNVYVPHIQSPRPLPVMVFVHGGGFFFGNSKSDYHFPQKLMEEGVIVVSFNYRQGALGFLSFPEAGIWGNMGLKDQRLALQWINENIERFHGDSSNVTIFGESAGGGACHLHCYSQHAHKLFHKAIMQSGSANTEWMFQRIATAKAYRLAELLGCTSKEPQEILKFLNSDEVTPLDILANTMQVLTSDERRRGLPMVFRPVLEHANSPDPFISKPIIELMKTPNILSMPTIMGYNNGEGLGFMVNTIRKVQEYDKDFARFVPRNIPLLPDSPIVKQIAQRMRDFYLGGHSLSPNLYNAMSNLHADYHFVVDMQNAAEWQVRHQPNAPLYFYRFDYMGKRDFYKQFYKLEHLEGACHGDDLSYLFQLANDTNPMDPEDELFSQKFCHLWANFARCGNPTPNGAEPPIIETAWMPVQRPNNDEPFELNYYVIDRKCRMEKNLEKDRVEFWREIYRSFEPTDYSILSAKL